MKTILYQPLFINPQAYFVFPQLYHIEKGDSYIEPANITGQLIINDLTKSLTSTPILNVVQDTNQVDFGLFKGKHIRISQYTNIGAVVLGEWYIPGTPEPEQPDWFKESIVAWYSPYCKQGMTNFDVIESYADDFTKWRIENTGVTSTQKKIVIAAGTELKYNVTYKGFGNSIAEFDIKYTGNAVIRYQYNKEDGTTGIITINRSGIYHLPASIKAQKNFGFYCNPQTVTEEATIEQLPTSILKDFSGNKHDAYLYGFKGKLNSGVGIYKVDFSKLLNNAFDNFEHFNNKFIAKGTYKGNYEVFGQYAVDGIVKNKVTVKITGVSNLLNKLTLQHGYITKDNKTVFKEMTIDNDGVYSYDFNDIEIPDENNIAQTIYNRFYFNKEVINDVNLIVEEIPDYPNQLCYDGKSYAVAYGLPILTDYTIIADRIWFAEKVDNGVFMSKALEQNGAFILEYKQGDKWNTYSYYSATNINIDKDNSIVYQTKNKYNEQTIYPGDKQDTDTLFIGVIRKDDSRSFIGCHGDILLFNRTLTEYEISWVKNNMMCSKQQEPDIDL